MTQYKMTRKPDRLRLEKDLIALAQAEGCEVFPDEFDRSEPTLLIQAPGVRAMVMIDRPAGGYSVPMINWHQAERPLQWHSAAWQSVNEFHRRKATSFCDTFEELFERLREGIRAARTGEAFKDEPEQQEAA